MFKYRHNYVSYKEIYESIKEKIDLTEEEYKKVIKAYLDEFTREVITNKQLVHLPNKMGYCYISKEEHKRPFHLRVDWEETKRTGELVRYKVPILDDYYYKLKWHRKGEMGRCKMMLLSKMKSAVRDVLKNDDY